MDAHKEGIEVGEVYRARAATTVWHLDLNAQEKDSGIAYGDHVARIAEGGDLLWLVGDNDGYLTVCTNKENPGYDEILGEGFEIDQRFVELVRESI